MLVRLLQECRDRLDADLRRFFKVRLSDLYAGSETIEHVANLAAHLPRGGAVGEWIGGAFALTGETDALYSVEHAVWASQSSKPGRVKPRPYPEGVREQEIKRERLRTNLRRYKRKRGVE